MCIENEQECVRYLLESSNQAPRNGEPNIGRVVDLSSQAVPTVDEDSALGSLDGLWVLDRLPRNLGEGLAPDNLASLHGTEAVLLAVATVPNPVPEEVSAIHDSKGETDRKSVV